MLKYVQIALLALLAVHPAVAADSKPTAESVQQLLDIQNTRNLVNGAMGQIESAMQASMKQWSLVGSLAPINRRFWMI